MATVETNAKNEQASVLKAEWLGRLTELIARIEQWAKESDWSTRRIDKRMRDSEIGEYIAPALILQKETAQIMLEPITRLAVGADGVVDLYLMPAYDDIARFSHLDGDWRLFYMFSGTSNPTSNWDAKPEILTQERITQIFDEMVKNAK